jgi:hypothetical protein
LPERDRESALNVACNGDGELREGVIALLEGDEEAGDSFLRHPAIEDAANLLGVPPSEEIAIPEVLVGRYRMGERIGAGGWASSIKPKICGSGAGWRSRYYPYP